MFRYSVTDKNKPARCSAKGTLEIKDSIIKNGIVRMKAFICQNSGLNLNLIWNEFWNFVSPISIISDSSWQLNSFLGVYWLMISKPACDYFSPDQFTTLNITGNTFTKINVYRHLVLNRSISWSEIGCLFFCLTKWEGT